MKKFETIEQYVKAILFFLLLGILLKTLETTYFLRLTETVRFTVLLKGFFSLLVVFCFYAVLSFPIYLIFIFIHKVVAKIFISIVFSFLILLETGLTIYLFKTGSLMGAELKKRKL